MAKAKRVTPGRKGYKILFTENTVIMNKKFAAAAAEYGTIENITLYHIRNDFPGMKEVVVSGRECDKAKPNHRLTYKHMEEYIECYENAEELEAVFETVKATSIVLANPYKYVSDWFKVQFPDYNKTIVFKDSKLSAVPKKAPDITKYKMKLPEVS
ncbi:MAG: hypothetical protein IJB59_11035 [Oscillospiraceae bacterium]|nr:hypothetical protein [Oscillospiraceae bacterium]